MIDSKLEEMPKVLPIIVENNTFLYPFMISPLFYNKNDENLFAIDKAIEQDNMVIIVPAKDNFSGTRSRDNIYSIGVIGNIMRKTNLPDGRVKILFQGIQKGIIKEFSDDLMEGVVDIMELQEYDSTTIKATLEILKEKLYQLSSVSDILPPELIKTIEDNYDPNRIEIITFD